MKFLIAGLALFMVGCTTPSVSDQNSRKELLGESRTVYLEEEPFRVIVHALGLSFPTAVAHARGVDVHGNQLFVALNHNMGWNKGDFVVCSPIYMDRMLLDKFLKFLSENSQKKQKKDKKEEKKTKSQR
ncbi:hypothetical protein KW782_00175 [Candidatus Parcubacteria bacterium]|nr:hypothetical protein [Candidatus Parcubacteria bacterium]